MAPPLAPSSEEPLADVGEIQGGPAPSTDNVLDDPRHLDWSSKQSRILTADGRAPWFYTADRGFPFRQDELPHHHLRSGASHAVFRKWASEADRRRQRSGYDGGDDDDDADDDALVGAWTRPLFASHWEHSTSDDEWVYNLQTSTLFVDVRIPRTRPTGKLRSAGSLDALTDAELRAFARQHAFGGYAFVGREKRPRPLAGKCSAWVGGEGGCARIGHRDDDIRAEVGGMGQVVCSRHHVVDWNYLASNPRNRPNKWWAEFMPRSADIWRECSYATDDFGQHFYWERWERLEGDGRDDRSNGHKGPVLAMRKCMEDCKREGGRDGILVVVGDHFSYIHGRPNCRGFESNISNPVAMSVVELIDLALQVGDRRTAEHYASVDAGHGTVSSGWIIDQSVRPWREGAALFSAGMPEVEEVATAAAAAGLTAYGIIWDDERWDILECSGMKNAAGLQDFFGTSGEPLNDSPNSRL